MTSNHLSDCMHETKLQCSTNVYLMAYCLLKFVELGLISECTFTYKHIMLVYIVIATNHVKLIKFGAHKKPELFRVSDKVFFSFCLRNIKFQQS